MNGNGFTVTNHHNGLKTLGLFAILWAVIMFVWWLTGARTETLWWYVTFGCFSTFASYWFSDRISTASMGAREVSEEQAPELYAIVRELSGKAGRPMPRIYIAPTMSPNAFATGRNEHHAVVCCTQGILQILNWRELRGVLSHELMHVYNHDILTSAIASAMGEVLTYLGYALMWAGPGDDDDSRNNGFLRMIGALLSMILAPIASALIRLAISRTREYDADEDGSKLTGDPEALASALATIEAGVNAVPMPQNQQTATVSALMIASPFKDGTRDLFSTHPSTPDRIARLNQMAAQMFQAGTLDTSSPYCSMPLHYSSADIANMNDGSAAFFGAN